MFFGSLLLKTFVADCDTRSFAKAASIVHLTRPAISLHIKRLEAQAGTRLMDRAGHRLALTTDGEILLSYARRILALHAEAKIELSRLKLDSAAPVPLGLFPSHCAWRRLALTRLDEAGRTWKVVLQSTGVTGIVAAVEAGLAVSVFAESRLTSLLRPLGPAEQLPPLPSFEYVMRQASNASVATNRLAEVIVDFFRLSVALRQSQSGTRPECCAGRSRRISSNQ